MPTDRRIERHQLPYFLQVFNRFTDKPIGYLGNVSDEGLMLISQLPLLVKADFKLQLKLPGPDDTVQLIDLNGRCLWSHEEATPGYYDSGFALSEPPEAYHKLVSALQHYFSFYPLEASA
ncbi:PilZ domain-containing protein [Pseudomonas agarici]|uniref:PilZ domain-containing protein n=1 Tax=Pseudomonas agarici TaxID=46677 RepID=UPI000300B3E1|nr:PilZ domain-containing protein [Pseudomonas agarici]NWB92212.1 PilZ domain-containing protein [Pseudomonas agarici]NWC07458.1 PilZ domain-containing protein [Pseudomonas agarici]SEK43518.1 PilZ domain-containing protein [Pseudomonas agarici]